VIRLTELNAMPSSNDPNPLRILVGVQGGGFNGIDAYAEQVAAAGALTGAEVTLVASTSTAAEAVRARLDGRTRGFESLISGFQRPHF
jgi:hypothetical protein